MKNTKLVSLLVISLGVAFTSAPDLSAASRGQMRREARAALNHLYSISLGARHLGQSARAVLVFPNIVNTRVNIGDQRGDGTLFVHDKAIGYYKFVAASSSLPAGEQKFGYALFFMSDDDLAYFRKSDIWEVGTGTGIVVVEKNQKRQEAAASTSASGNEMVTVGPSPVTSVAHASQVTHRPAMNDQQEAAPRPDNLTLDPEYRGFIALPNAGLLRIPTTTPLRNGIYAFAFGGRALIAGLSLKGTKITPLHPD